jgi:hypothetical protein
MKSIQRLAAAATALLFLATAAGTIQAQNTPTDTSRSFTGSGDTAAAASGAGSSLTQQNLFSTGGETGTGVGQLGSGAGRFLGNQLANQPLAGQNNIANQSFNRLLQVQTLQQSNRLSSQFNGGRSSGSTMFRPSLRLGFAVRTRPTTEISSSINRRFAKLTSRFVRLAETRPAFSSVKFVVGNNGTVVLSGQVESDSARRLATNLLRMEPGVRSVTNELVVAAK